MSTRYSNGSHYQNHQRAAELHDVAAHAHMAAQQHGKLDRLTAHEQSRQALEHSQTAHLQTQATANRHGIVTFGHADIAARAHSLWKGRGCPEGTPDLDWFHAIEELASHA